VLFNSFEFAAFFAAVLACYFAVRGWAWRKAILVAASYIFYGSWYPPYALLLLATSAFDYLIAARMDEATDTRLRKAWLIASVTANLAVLSFFKYGGFIVDNINLALQSVSLPALAAQTTSGWIVPIGLSFYTFQSIAYVCDVYRRDVRAVRSWPDYLAFVSFFPLLAAGPIMRARDLVAQFEIPRPVPTLPVVGTALYLIVLGLFQKVVMADNLAPLVNFVFKTPLAFSSIDLWAAVYGFAFQIYFDFAGYSNMAMGIAALLGFTIPRNFSMPYIALGFSDFWRRWHITLSQWLRDYLYIPLGGNRYGRLLTFRNLMLTMVLGGLWHGASWTFVIWGALHGIYLSSERIVKAVAAHFDITGADTFIGRFLSMVLTFHLVCVGWIFFRVEGGTGQAVTMLKKMALWDGAALAPAIAAQIPMVVVALAFLVSAWIVTAARGDIPLTPSRKAVLTGLMLAALTLIPGNRNAFFYFQF
jgi:alginate O-acetyltransferase complex protein AlgI